MKDKNILLVEGKDEQFVIPFFMDNFVVWGKKKADWIVEIKEFGGIENLLRAGVIEAELKAPGLHAVGIIIDANDSFEARRDRVKERCGKVIGGLPERLPLGGLIVANEHGLRVGVWIMPDNKTKGMLETFLSYLLEPKRQVLWEYAKNACDGAKRFDGTYTDAHRDKAYVFTYLAFIEPPGLSLQCSVLQHAFDARLPLADNFVRWFMDLYQLRPRQPAPDSSPASPPSA